MSPVPTSVPLTGRAVPAAVAAQQRAATGSLAGQNVVRLVSPSQAIQDIQEEIGFTQAERAEEKDIKDEILEDRTTHESDSLIREIEEKCPPGDPGRQTRSEACARMLRQGLHQSAASLNDALNDLCGGDKAEVLATLETLLRDPPVGLAPERLALAREARDDLLANHAPEIRAGLNTMALAHSLAKTDSGARKLQAMYQSTVVDYKGILGALRDIVRSAGAQGFDEARGFIMRAAEEDLAAGRSSVEPERLRASLSELQGLKVFNTIRERLDNDVTRHAKRQPMVAETPKEEWLTRFLDCVHEPNDFQERLGRPVARFPLSDQALFLQDMRANARALPEWLFASPSDRARAVYPIQQAIDYLVLERGA